MRFGVLGSEPLSPVPVVFNFSMTLEQALMQKAYCGVVNLLSRREFIGVSLDLPCHGEDRRPEEPEGLDGWRTRIDAGENLVREFNCRASDVLDWLISKGYTEPGRVAACGTSRGGFLAMHFAAHDARVGCAVAFSPVTDLAALSEFEGATENEMVKSLALANHVRELARRKIWMCIGNNDLRVGTDRVIALLREVTQEATAQRILPEIELHITPVPGHAVHATAHQEAAGWLASQLNDT